MSRVLTMDAARRERSPDSVSRDGEWPADFEAFVDGHSARLVKSLALITLDRGLAEDAAQEAFLQLYLHWREVPGMRDPAAWLYRVGMNRCKNYRRALSRTAGLIDRLGRSVEGGQYPPEQWSPEADFVALFQPLPKRQRTAVALHYLADLSTSEIARTMGISQGAVSSHLHKARESLRKVLEAR
jgi:RNA polymerase sigma-70 factor (ECF subfamily)